MEPILKIHMTRRGFPTHIPCCNKYPSQKKLKTGENYQKKLSITPKKRKKKKKEELLLLSLMIFNHLYSKETVASAASRSIFPRLTRSVFLLNNLSKVSKAIWYQKRRTCNQREGTTHRNLKKKKKKRGGVVQF